MFVNTSTRQTCRNNFILSQTIEQKHLIYQSVKFVITSQVKQVYVT